MTGFMWIENPPLDKALTKKIPNSLSIGLYLDQLINLSSIRKADKSRLSCAISIKIYREVSGHLSYTHLG